MPYEQINNDASCVVATQFTLFPKLIPELRLEIWRLVLPTPYGKLLYPYNKGCWVFEDYGLEPDPNGEDLYFKFNASRLEPLHIDLPLYSVNQEARDITLEWLHNRRAAVSRTNRNAYAVLRPFRPGSDIMFVPANKLEAFVTEPADHVNEPEMVGRYFGTSDTALRRFAVTPEGLQLLKVDLLGELFDFVGKVRTICVVYSASADRCRELDSVTAGEDCVLGLRDEPLARMKWSYARAEWIGSRDDSGWFARLRDYVEGLTWSHGNYELEVQLLGLA